MNPALQAAVIVARNRRARRLLLALAAGAIASLLLIVAVTVSSVGAAASVCQQEAGEQPSATPTGYVSTEPSREALADIPPHYLDAYRRAAEEYGIDWAILAAIGRIESGHGERGEEVTCIGSSAGAQGPMQFMPSTWASMGVDGNGDGARDVCQYEDAIFGAANYLAQSGAPQDYGAALFSYNHAQWYVDDVLAQAEEYRAAVGEEEAVASSNGVRPALAKLLSPSATKLAYAAEGGAAGGTVGDPGETAYSGPEIETLGLINAYREENGLEPLLLSDKLSVASARYAHDMAKHDAYSEPEAHVTGPSDWYPEGADLTDRMNAEGYYAGRYGENVAAGQGTAEEVFEAWRTSPPHNEMMLDPEMEAVGIGLVENPETSYGEFWVTDFGSDPDETARPVPEAAEFGGGPVQGSGIAGDAKAVFPLPEEHLDSYEDTWGAGRGSGRTHEGTDLFAPDGTPIYSITDGTVVPVSGAAGGGWNPLGGWTVMVEASESVGPVRRGDTLYYAHMLEPTPLKPGDAVEAGQQIGRVGSTGEGPPGTLLQPASRGQHLHLGWYDPGGSRAQAPSGAMNPYPLLEWLKESGGTVTGGDTYVPSPSGGGLPAYCVAFKGLGIISGIGGRIGVLFGDGGAGAGVASPSAPLGDVSAQELLDDPNFSGSPAAVSDLENGVVDERLVAVLGRVTEEHRIHVSVFRSGHPYGATLPASMGGVPNSHYYGLTADVSEVDGKDVASNQTDPDVLDVGRILLSIPPAERPNEIIGPTAWTQALAVSREDGFVTDPTYTDAHYHHLHVGYSP